MPDIFFVPLRPQTKWGKGKVILSGENRNMKEGGNKVDNHITVVFAFIGLSYFLFCMIEGGSSAKPNNFSNIKLSAK